MKFAIIPKRTYSIGEIIGVQGRKLRVVDHSHTGKNIIATSLEDAPKFERVICILSDADRIIELLHFDW